MKLLLSGASSCGGTRTLASSPGAGVSMPLSLDDAASASAADLSDGAGLPSAPNSPLIEITGSFFLPASAKAFSKADF